MGKGQFHFEVEGSLPSSSKSVEVENVFVENYYTLLLHFQKTCSHPFWIFSGAKFIEVFSNELYSYRFF